MGVPHARMPGESDRSPLVAASIIVGLCLAAALFAVQLNGRFYARNQPFYDSMSYHTKVHRVMTRAASEGVLPAVSQACRSSTVCLPLVLAAVVGPFLEPSRGVGIAIQWLELLFFAGTLAFYLARIRGFSPMATTIAVVPFLLWRCLYEPNGGLSDLRMDLSLALLHATTVLWYLIAVQTLLRRHFLVLGLSAAAACLFRATAPVYLVLALLPLVVADLVPQAPRPERLRGLAVAAAVAFAGCGWFFLLNYAALHYYYVVWNTDANAKLPFREAINHAAFAARHVGLPAAVLAVAFPLVWLADRRFAGSRPLPEGRGLAFDWQMAWIALAPVVLLVSRGAGLNPYVSMPAAFGLTMLLMLPVSGRVQHGLSRPASIGLLLLAVGCTAVVAARGWREHFGGSVDSMAAHREVIRSMVDDARRIGRDGVSYATTHCYYLNQDSLESVALFDVPGAGLEGRSPRIDGVTLHVHSGFAVVAEAEWAAVPGDTTESKLDHMLADADREIDYLAIPDDETSRFVQEHLPHNVVNRHAIVLRRRLLESGRWQPVTTGIRNGEHEVIVIYRNGARLSAKDSLGSSFPFPVKAGQPPQ